MSGLLIAIGAWLMLLPLAGKAVGETATVKLSNGDTVTGEVIEKTAERMVLRHPILGRLEIPTADLAPASTHPGVMGTSFLAGWDKELGIGLGGSQGDTDEADLRLAARLERKQLRWHTKLDARYELSFGDKEIDDHSARLTLLHDWLWPDSRWFAFTYEGYDYDDFEAWKHRATLGAGPGYHLILGPAFTLDSRFGPFYTYEFGDENKSRPEFALGVFADWTIREGHTLELDEMFLQTLDEAEFRNINNFAWKIRLDFRNWISLKIGFRNEYDSASEKSKNNLKYYSSINFDL